MKRGIRRQAGAMPLRLLRQPTPGPGQPQHGSCSIASTALTAPKATATGVETAPRRRRSGTPVRKDNTRMERTQTHLPMASRTRRQFRRLALAARSAHNRARRAAWRQNAMPPAMTGRSVGMPVLPCLASVLVRPVPAQPDRMGDPSNCPRPRPRGAARSASFGADLIAFSVMASRRSVLPIRAKFALGHPPGRLNSDQRQHHRRRRRPFRHDAKLPPLASARTARRHRRLDTRRSTFPP
jgi:hypothetical protein